MAKMKGATWVGEHGSYPMTVYDIVCIHTIGGGTAPAHAAQFSTAMDGQKFQSRDTKFRSAANWQGNHRIIAIENADVPPKWTDLKDLPDFTDAQVQSIAEIIVWCHRTHGIPIVPCPNSRPGSRGIAYHRQGIDGNFGPGYEYKGRVPGGELWSEHYGKVCPTDKRIKTLLEKIIPLAQKMARPPAPPTIPTYGEDDMLLITVAGTESAFIFTGNMLLRVKGHPNLTALRSGGMDKMEGCTPEQFEIFKKAVGGKIVDV